MKKLLEIQAELKCPKGSLNKFGNYKYRSAEQILESVKPLLQTVNGFAELGEHKGMSSEQCTGTASSYARKYALNGLFLIDETESDPDSKDNTKTEAKKPTIDNARFEKAIESIRNSEFTVEQLKDKFELTELQTKALLLI